MPAQRIPIELRLWSRIQRRGPDECWEWQARLDARGYGVVSLNQKSRLAHRVVWLLTKGDPGTLNVCHRCDNPRCCNPAHLFLGTREDNNRDRHLKGRTAAHKLSADKARQIYALYHSKQVSQPRLAARFGVSVNTVYDICRGRLWRTATASQRGAMPWARTPTRD